MAGADFLGIIQELTDNKIKVLMKNKVYLNDEFEIITPNYSTKAKVINIINNKRETNDVAHTNDVVLMEVETTNDDWKKEANFGLLRTIGIKDNSKEIKETTCE